MKHPLQAPQPPCHSECSSPLHLLCPSDTSSYFLCPGLDLPSSLSSSPHAWLLGRQGSATSRWCSDGGHHVQAHRLEWRRGYRETQKNLLLSRWGNRGPERAQALPRVTQQQPPCLSFLNPPSVPLNGFKGFISAYRYKILVHFQPLLPSLETAIQSLRSQKSSFT